MRAQSQFMLVAVLLLQAPVLGWGSDPPSAPPSTARFSGQTYPVADEGPESFTGLLVLDDRDQGVGPTFTGDALSLIGESGEVTWTTTGFSICETIGGHHQIAVDAERKRIYVAENVAGRVTALDFAGRRRFDIVGMHASSIAVDVQWGHLWVSAGQTIRDGNADL
jgi:hypothetical protein